MIDTIHGPHSSAIIYSIAETERVNNLKLYDYFMYLFEEIPKHMNEKDCSFIEDLLKFVWIVEWEYVNIVITISCLAKYAKKNTM